MELTRSATDIVQSKLSDASVELEEERERLANATGSTEDGNLGQLICQRAAGQHTRSGIQDRVLGVETQEQAGEGGQRAHTLRAEAEKALRWILEANMMI